MIKKILENLNKEDRATLKRAALAAGTTEEKMLKNLNGLLLRRKCRDTNGSKIFSSAVRRAISLAA